MEKICTTKEQGRELLKLGIERKTSDMYWPLGFPFPEVCDEEDKEQVDYPAWTLGALLQLIPSSGTLFILRYKGGSVDFCVTRGSQTYNYECKERNLFDSVFKLVILLRSDNFIPHV